MTRADLHSRFTEILAPYGAQEAVEKLLDVVYPPSVQLSQKDLDAANAKVDYILQAAKGVTYTNRERIPERVRDLCDAYVEGCGKDRDGQYIHEPTKSQLAFYILTLDEWRENKVKPEHVIAAWEYVRGPKGGFPVANPAALTKTILGIKAQGAIMKPKTDEVERTRKMLEEKEAEKKYVPMPESARLALKRLESQMGRAK